MKTAYFDCYSGISGDMCLGALIDAGADQGIINDMLMSLPLTGWQLKSQKVMRGALSATKIEVECKSTSKQEPRRNLGDIIDIINAGNLPATVAEKAIKSFQLIAEAEAGVHQKKKNEIHFHEVGAVDSIIDIVGSLIGLWVLKIERVFASTVSLGGGVARTMHGDIPVPSPAAIRLLKGFRVQGGPAEKELTTPTGAALLQCLASWSEFIPDIKVEASGYGAGFYDPETWSNTLRVILGEQTHDSSSMQNEQLWVIETSLDDMTGEEMGYLLQKTLSGGALDADISHIQMKKGRPAFRFTALSSPSGRDGVIEHIFNHSSTLGVKYWPVSRKSLERKKVNVTTCWGKIGIKVALKDGRETRFKPEFEDCRKIADKHNISVRKVYKAAEEAFKNRL